MPHSGEEGRTLGGSRVEPATERSAEVTVHGVVGGWAAVAIGVLDRPAVLAADDRPGQDREDLSKSGDGFAGAQPDQGPQLLAHVRLASCSAFVRMGHPPTSKGQSVHPCHSSSRVT